MSSFNPVLRPSSPSLIDFQPRQLPRTLIEQEDYFGIPPPEPVFKPYKDDVTEDTARAVVLGSRAVKHFKPCLSKKVTIKSPKETVRAGTSENPAHSEPGGGIYHIQLPDGSQITWKPQSSGNGNIDSKPPVIANGIEEALEALKRLAVEAPTAQNTAQIKACSQSPVLSKKVTQGISLSRQTSFSDPETLESLLQPPISSNPSSTSSSLTLTPSTVEGESSIILPSAGEDVSHLFKYDIPPVPFPILDLPIYNGGVSQSKKEKQLNPSRPKDPVSITDKRRTAELEAELQTILAKYQTNLDSNKQVKAETTIPVDSAKTLDSSSSSSTDKTVGSTLLGLDPLETGTGKKKKRKKGKKSEVGTSKTEEEVIKEVQKLVEEYTRSTHPLAGLDNNILNPFASEFKVSSSFEPTFESVVEDTPVASYRGEYTEEARYLDIHNNSYTSEAWNIPDKVENEMNPPSGYGYIEIDGVADHGNGNGNGNGNEIRHGGYGSSLLSGHNGGVSMNRELSPPFQRFCWLPSARSNAPSNLVNHPDRLQSTMMRSWLAAEPPAEQQRYIAHLAQTLTRIVNTHFGEGELARFSVDVFGSVSWGGETGKGGDVDLVIRDTHHEEGYHPDLWIDNSETSSTVSGYRRPKIYREGLSKIYDLHNLVPILRKKGFVDVQGIYGASTPIVKFKDPNRPGMECDVNMNDLGGWYNSKLILAYCEISPYVLRPLIHSLKLWAKANNINDPSGRNGIATMSSYCLTLMAIGYLQSIGMLPNLQEDVEVRIPDKIDQEGKDVIWVGWGKSSGVKANIGFNETAPHDWSISDPYATAAQVFRGFFKCFARTIENGRYPSAGKFDYTSEIVSVLNGGIINRELKVGQLSVEAQLAAKEGRPIPRVTKEENMERETRMGKGNIGIQPRNWAERRLVVQDPFIWQKNCTQSMSRTGMDRWLLAVDNTHKLLETYGDRATFDNIIANALPPPPGLLAARIGGTPSPSRGGGYRGRNPFGSPRGRGMGR